MITFAEWFVLKEGQGWELFHGSNSGEITGALRVNERDSGWFGAGFYLTAYPTYAKKWGQYIYKMMVPNGKYAEVQVTGNYDKIDFIGDAKVANQEAGGDEAWIENEEAWSKKFTNTLRNMGFLGIRIHLNTNKDSEVLVFNPSSIQVVGRIN